MKKTSRLAKRPIRVLAVVLILCMMLSMLALTSFAVNEKVKDVSHGVLQFIMTWRDAAGFDWTISTGTAFLINENTIITCQHNLALEPWTVVGSYVDQDGNEQPMTMTDYFPEIEKMTLTEFYGRKSYNISVSRDVTIGAKEIVSSVECDYAILKLDQSLENRNSLTLRHSDEVEVTEDVYAVGFPGLVQRTETINKYTAGDVTITDGRVSKANVLTDRFTGFNSDYIQTSCKLTHGISGGPMVDNDGNVIGLCSNGTGEAYEADDYYYAVCIDQVIIVLDSLGIKYQLKGVPDPIPTDPTEPTETAAPTPAELDFSELNKALGEAEDVKEADYDTESFGKLQTAISNAKEAKNGAKTQADINAAVTKLQNAKRELQPKSGIDTTMLIIIIAVAAIVVIAAIILIVVLNSKKNKKKKAGTASQPRVPYTPPAQPKPNAPVPGQGGFAPGQMSVAPPTRPNTVPLTPEAGATTVLSQGAGETTVLSQSVRGGTLIRKKNGERLEINKAEFLIGRERNKVTYCISDNTSIGRTHAKVVVRNGTSYLVDLNSTNGTFVNGVKASPNQEVPLKNGDKVVFADETFEFQV